MPQPDDEPRTTIIADDETGTDSQTRTSSDHAAAGVAALQRYKQLWRIGPPPDLQAFTAASDPFSDDMLASILRADLQYRWAEGRALPVEWYLERFERLALIPDLAVDLIYAEYLQAEKHGQPRGAEEFFLRFPQHRQTLRDQFELHGAICNDDTAIESDDDSVDVSLNKPIQQFPSVPGYQIVEEVGRGGIGVVYRAHDPRLNRTVALKLLLSGSHASVVQLRRFQVEAEAAARLQHRNIVQIHEIGEHEGRPYLALEFVRGGSLADRYRGQPQAPRWSAALVEQLARAIEFAHRNGIIHRDLKPANVLLEESGEWDAVSGKHDDVRQATPTRSLSTPSLIPKPQFSTPTPKITDFGLAKLLSIDTVAATDDATQTGDVIGTPSYMAPEQAAGRVHEIGVPTDVYALGAILYELLTGRPPFVGATPLETMRQVVESEPVYPSRLIRSMPTDLQTICLKCLAKEPRKRYASANELADDLQRFLVDRPILARRTGATERVWRWTRRNPLVAGLIGTVLCLLAAGLPTMTALFLSEQSQAARAEENFHLASGAVERYLTNVGESPELKAHGLETLRRNLLLTAKDFYEQLGTRRRHDRAFQADLANAHDRLAFISDELGDLDSAVEQYSLMRDIATDLVRDHPLDRDYLQLLVKSQGLLGNVYQEMGNSEAAELHMKRASETFQRILRTTPTTPRVRLDLAAMILDQRALYSTMDRNAEEDKCFQDAQRLCDELRADPPDISQAGSHLANTYNGMAVAFMSRGMFREAETYYEAARDVVEQLAAKFPDVPQHAADLAMGFCNLANLYTNEGRNDEARAAFDKSNQLLDRLTVEHPLILDYQNGAAGNWLNIGSLEFGAGNWEAAGQAWQQARRKYAILIKRHPNVPDYSLDFAKSTSNLGNVSFMRERFSECEGYYAEAIAVVESLMENQPENAELRGFVVGVQSNLATAYQSLNKIDKALELYGNAAQVQRSIVASQPNVPDHRRRLAGSLLNLANVLHKTEKYSDAEAVMREACEVTGKLVDEHPDIPDYADVLGDSLKLLGNIRFNSNRLADAEASYFESLRVREALVREHEDVAHHRIKLGTVQLLLGYVARDTYRPAEAIDWFDQAIGNYEPEWRKSKDTEPSDRKTIRESLCDAHWEKARALYRLERVPEALVECDLSLGFTTGTRADGLHALRARVLARLMRTEEALIEARSVSDSTELSSLDMIDLAATYALAAKSRVVNQEELRLQSIEMLRQAGDKSARYVEAIDSDPDFAGVGGSNSEPERNEENHQNKRAVPSP